MLGMQHVEHMMDTPMVGLPKGEWLEKLATASDEMGFFETLGNHHYASFVDENKTLLVTFETIQGIQALSENGQPLGWDLVRENNWSHLCIMSDGDTWFREDLVYALFDRLVDDGFFDEFEHVLFYGAGPCAYAAAAYSVVAPGATVVAIQPQATLDPEVAGWDDRFTDRRRLCFTDRYGYAPDMIEAAQQMFVLYDPQQRLDAMHAALFKGQNVTNLRMPYMGGALQSSLVAMEILNPLLALAGTGALNRLAFARLYRARRENRSYLRTLLGIIDREDRTGLATMLCGNVIDRMNAPHFRQRLQLLNAKRRSMIAAVPDLLPE
jgi:hypothetical protein